MLATLLLAVAVTDAKRLVIPDALNGALLATGLARCGVEGVLSLAVAAAGAAAVFALFYAVRGVHTRLRGVVGLGLGDVKFLAAASTVLVACLSGLAYAVIRYPVAGRPNREVPIAFGPHLTVGTASAWGAQLVWLTRSS
jgi:leader peptidase (prepilin peptidase)/N-methyltransferase